VLWPIALKANNKIDMMDKSSAKISFQIALMSLRANTIYMKG